jgi:hypothetical protein
MRFQTINVAGFVEVEGAPELSHQDPMISLSNSGLSFIRQPAGYGALLTISAISFRWFVEALRARERRSSITCEGEAIGTIQDAVGMAAKDGVGINAISSFTCSVSSMDTMKFQFDGVVGGVVFGGGIKGLEGSRIKAGFRHERAEFQEALLAVRS